MATPDTPGGTASLCPEHDYYVATPDTPGGTASLCPEHDYYVATPDTPGGTASLCPEHDYYVATPDTPGGTASLSRARLLCGNPRYSWCYCALIMFWLHSFSKSLYFALLIGNLSV